MPAKNVVFLTGAPGHDSLDWSEVGLASVFTIPCCSENLPKWRAVSVISDELRHVARVDEKANGDVCPPQFYTYTVNQTQEDFFCHSFAALESIDLEKLTQATSAAHSTTSSFLTIDTNPATSFGSTTSNAVSQAQEKHSLRGRCIDDSLVNFKPVTDLKAFPTAGHINSINPQTITCNLAVGIISISSPKTIHMRRKHGAQKTIVELTVGDETRAGFAINLWISPSHESPVADISRPKDPLRNAQTGKLQLPSNRNDLTAAIGRMRTGSVVLIRNIALDVYNGNVYGQSMSHKFSRNSTEIIEVDDAGQIDPDLNAKLARVRGWVRDFVGEVSPSTAHLYRKTDGTGDTEHQRYKRHALPPDSYEE